MSVRVRVMVLKATFNNISAILWSIFLLPQVSVMLLSYNISESIFLLPQVSVILLSYNISGSMALKNVVVFIVLA
jgi:hypothetical protein